MTEDKTNNANLTAAKDAGKKEIKSAASNQKKDSELTIIKKIEPNGENDKKITSFQVTKAYPDAGENFIIGHVYQALKGDKWYKYFKKYPTRFKEITI